jgi:Protein of unknown function (DUF2505)
MTLRHSSFVGAPVDHVARVICGEHYNMDNQTTREDVVEARYESLDEGDERHRFDVHVTAYKRTKTGKLDKSGTVRTKTEYRWDGRTRKLHWTHIDPEGDRVQVGGVTTLISEGTSTRVEREVNIDIRIPIIGRGIVKIVEREFRKGLDRSAKLLDRIAREEDSG